MLQALEKNKSYNKPIIHIVHKLNPKTKKNYNPKDLNPFLHSLFYDIKVVGPHARKRLYLCGLIALTSLKIIQTVSIPRKHDKEKTSLFQNLKYTHKHIYEIYLNVRKEDIADLGNVVGAPVVA